MRFPYPTYGSTGRHPLFMFQDYQISPGALGAFGAYISNTSIIRDFMIILSQSPMISTLWITLEIGISIKYGGGFAQLVPDKTHSWSRAKQVAYSLALGVWLECGVLDPLRELKNVECAIVNARSLGHNGGDLFVVLQKKYADIVEQLEDDIES